SPPPRRSCRAAGCGRSFARAPRGLDGGPPRQQAAQLAKHLLCPGVHVARDLDAGRDVEVAAAVARQPPDALTAQPEGLATLGARWDHQVYDAVHSPDPHPAPQHRLYQGDRHLAVEVVPLACVPRVLVNTGDDDQVPSWPAERPRMPLAGHPQLGSGVEPRGKHGMDRRTPRRYSAVPTGRARLGHARARPVAGRARHTLAGALTPDRTAGAAMRAHGARG